MKLKNFLTGVLAAGLCVANLASMPASAYTPSYWKYGYFNVGSISVTATINYTPGSSYYASTSTSNYLIDSVNVQGFAHFSGGGFSNTGMVTGRYSASCISTGGGISWFSSSHGAYSHYMSPSNNAMYMEA